MAWRPHGRAGGTDPDDLHGASWSTCDRCGFNYRHRDLSWQHQWSGRSIINLHLLVCDRCLDVPAPFLRTPILPPDPPSIRNARVEPYSIDETDFRVTDGSAPDIYAERRTQRITDSSGINRIIETDIPVTSLNNAPGQQPAVPHADSTVFTADNTYLTADNGPGVAPGLFLLASDGSYITASDGSYVISS